MDVVRDGEDRRTKAYWRIHGLYAFLNLLVRLSGADKSGF
jgi:hypothetical protein